MLADAAATPNAAATDQWDAVRAELNRGNKINAIRIVREKTGWSLEEAKNYVESLPLVPDPSTPRADSHQVDPRSSGPEITYYSDGAITVTSKRAVLGGKTYAMANVTSVSLGEKPSQNPGAGCAMIALGGFMALCVLTGDAAAIGFFGLPGIVIVLIGLYVMFSGKPSYVVRIGSASGESDAVQHPDRGYIQRVVDAVNAAIVRRS